MNFFRTVFDTCSYFRNYRAFRDVPAWDSIKYLIKLITLLSTLGLVAFIPVASEMVERYAQWADRHFPPFKLQDGLVKTSIEQPYRSGDTNFLFILDTTGVTTQADNTAFYGLLVTSNNFVFWVKNINSTNGSVQAKRQDLKGFPDGEVNGDYFRYLIHAFAWVAFPLALVMVILIALLTCMIQAYIFAFLAAWVERNNPRGLRMPQLLNVSLHAVTPAAIVYTAYLALRLEGIDLWLMYLVIYGIFVVGGSNACRDQLPKEEREEDGLL